MRPLSSQYQFIYNRLMQQPYDDIAQFPRPHLGAGRTHEETVEAARNLPRAPVEDWDNMLGRNIRPTADMWDVWDRQKY